AKYTVISSFLLYVFGYLTLRFHLTALGIATDLAVLDERYLFAGAWFLVVLVTTIPKVGLMTLFVMAAAWVPHRLLPIEPQRRIAAWLMQPARLAAFGLMFSLIVIQSMMSQCFLFSNLLLGPELPANPPWLRRWLLDQNDRPVWFYFDAMVAACVLTLAVLWALRGQALFGTTKIIRALLVFLAGVQVLMLPVNYGWLIADKSLPRVTAVGDKPLGAGEQAWLVWEGKEGVTYLLRDGKRRALLTVPHSEVKHIEIIGFDKILPVLYEASPAGGG
ncbi:MAG TPA: hypothetical protein VF427_09970, partial [Noviherbaspirillum sp.]